MFYIYEWYIVATGEIIYVGKGSKNRYKSKKKNKFLNRLIETENCDVRIIAYYSTEEEAFEAERKRINSLKEVNQAICNKCVYSTGGKAGIWTAERRKDKSINNPMKRKEQRDRMSKENPMKRADVAANVGKQHRKPLFIGDKEFEWAKEASEEYKVSKSTIFEWVHKGKTSFGVPCGYINRTEKAIIQETKKENLTHTIIYNGIEFHSSQEAANYAGVKTTSTIIRWCRKGFSPTGISCRYKDDTKEYTYEPPNKSHGKSVIIDGVKYKSILEASKITGLSDYIIRNYYLNNKHGNQHPSQGNFDNSTLEGSETNG